VSSVVSKVLGTVNAPYSADVSAHQLAACITSLDTMQEAFGQVFSFFTEVKLDLQEAFIQEMGIEDGAKTVAAYLQTQCANPVPLAA